MAEPYDERLFLGYLEGDLSPSEMVQFEKQMLGDARLRNLVAQLVLDRHRLRRMPDDEPPTNLMEHIAPAIERKMLLTQNLADVAGRVTPAANVRRFRYTAAAVLAASLLLMVGLFYLPLTDFRLLKQIQDPTPLADNSPETSAPLPALADASAVRELHENALAGGKQPERSDQLDRASLALSPAPPPAPAAIAALSSGSFRQELGKDAQFASVGLGPVEETAERSAASLRAEAEKSARAAASRPGSSLSEESAAATGGVGEAGAAAPATTVTPDAAAVAKVERLAEGHANALDRFRLAQTPAKDEDSSSVPRLRNAEALRLQVLGADELASREAVLAWASDNRVQAISTHTPRDTDRPDPRDRKRITGQLTLLVRSRQVPDLVASLNRTPNQQAQLLAPAATALPASVSAAAHPRRTDPAPTFTGDATGKPAAPAVERTQWGVILGDLLPLDAATPLDESDRVLALEVHFEYVPAPRPER